MTQVLIAAVVIGVTGLLIALLLGFAAIQFEVPVDEKEIAVREFLPSERYFPAPTAVAAVMPDVMPLQKRLLQARHRLMPVR